MEEIVFKSDDLLVMNLLNYFITEENYNPMIVHGITDEIWLENLNSDYKIIRIVSHHIHNKEQLAFDKFKLGKIVKEVASICGGGGGGRPNMAQAGGKNPDGIDAAIAKVKEVLEKQV